MKKTLLFCLFLINNLLFSQEAWRPFDGVDNLNQPSELPIGNACSAVGSDNSLYVLSENFMDGYLNFHELTLKKRINTKWETVGNSPVFSSTQVWIKKNTFFSLAINSNDVPYVVYSDQSNYKISVKKFNGVSWEIVGVEGFSAGKASSNQILIDKNNVPYVVYNDEQNGGITVQKFNGVSWEVVGNTSFSAGGVDFTKLAFDTTNHPLVIYKDLDNNGKATVQRFNGLTWEILGVSGFSAGAIKNPSITVDANNTIYVCFAQNVTTNTIAVEKLVGNTWQVVNTDAIFKPYGENFDFLFTLSLKIDKMNEPILMFETKNTLNGRGDNGIYFWKYINSNWENITGNQEIKARNESSNVVLYSTSFEIDSLNNIYLFYSSNINGFAAVKKKNKTTNSWDDVMELSRISENFQNNTVKLSVSNDNVQYISYFNSNGSIQIKKFNGIDWEIFSVEGFPTYVLNFTKITFDTNNVPYVVYSQSDSPGLPNSIFVMKFNGISWEFVGNQSALKGYVSGIAFDSNNKMFLAYSDGNNSNRLRVRSFDGINWSNVGTNALSETSFYQTAEFLIDSNSIPYISFQEQAGPKSIKRFLNNNWEDITDIFDRGYGNTTLAIDNLNKLFAIGFNSIGEPNIIKFNGSNWQIIAPLPTNIAQTKMAINKNDNTIYIYGIQTNNEIIVKKLNGTVWENLKNYPSRSSNAYYFDFIVNNNIPQIAYSNNGVYAKFYGNPDALSIKDISQILEKSFSIYPNPVKNIFSIFGSQKVNEIKIFNLVGKNVLIKKNPSQEINIEFLPKGTYILKAKTEKGDPSFKIIKE